MGTKNFHGFMMVELLIAILIMAIMTFVCMGYYTKTAIIQKDAALYFQATTVLSSALEKILSEKILPSHTQHTEGVFTIDWNSQLLAPTYGSNKQFVTIEVTVSWQSCMEITRKITMRSGFALQRGVIT